MNKKKHHFFAFLSRMKYINRWGLMRNTQPENIQEHSLQVGLIAHAMAVTANKLYGGHFNADRIAVMALYHDSNETITGDMPTPVKYFNPDISKAYKAVEDISKNKLLSMLPDEIKSEYSKILFYEADDEAKQIIKAADRIAAYIKCIEEAKAGNAEFKKAGKSIYNDIAAIDRPEVKYFIDNFLPSFSLTLDELE